MPKKTILWEECHCFIFLKNLFNVWLNRKQLYFKRSASAFNLLWYFVWVEGYEENPTSQSLYLGKRSISITLLDNCSDSFFFNHTKTDQLQSRTWVHISELFMLCYIKIHALWIPLLPIHGLEISYINHLKNTDLVSYVDLPNTDTLHSTVF